MIIVSGAFVICWFPVTTYYLFVDASTYDSPAAGGLQVGYHMTVFLSQLYICMNPFIYALKHEPVKEILTGLVASLKQRVGVTTVGAAAP